jgi:hypothetical protein
MERLEALGCDPLEGMAKIAMDQAAPLELRGRMYAELAAYVYPKRKSMEHTGSDTEPLTILVRKFSSPRFRLTFA